MLPVATMKQVGRRGSRLSWPPQYLSEINIEAVMEAQRDPEDNLPRYIPHLARRR